MSKLNKMILVMQIKRVKVFAHWSVILIGIVILLGAVEDPFLAFTVLASYYGLILIHECGHMFAALRRGSDVLSIELYPIWGVTRFTSPYSRFDNCVIAWGGVAAQAVVAVPLVAWVMIFGYTRYQPVNAFLVILGFFNLYVAAFNLLPVRPLDGSIAWGLLPTLFKRSPAVPIKRAPGWRSWR
jgi:Zn-dependent protease